MGGSTWFREGSAKVRQGSAEGEKVVPQGSAKVPFVFMALSPFVIDRLGKFSGSSHEEQHFFHNALLGSR